MKYAVIKTGGKQYRVSEGMILPVDRLSTEKDKKHTFSEILLFRDGETVQIGKPFVSGVFVEATVLEHGRGEKVRVSQYKAKVRERRVIGFRAELTKIRIDSIGKKGSQAEKVAPAKPAARTKSKA